MPRQNRDSTRQLTSAFSDDRRGIDIRLDVTHSCKFYVHSVVEQLN